MDKAQRGATARRLARCDNTAGHDGERRPSSSAYQELRARGQLTARIYSIQNHGVDGLTAAGVATGFGDDWIRIGGIKLFADGSMGSGTAAFFEPYTDDPSTTGSAAPHA